MTDTHLPELPEPSWRETRPTNPPRVAAEWFTADQMRAYATAAVLAEREKNAALCEAVAAGYDPAWAADMQRLALHLASAIRGSSPPPKESE